MRDLWERRGELIGRLLELPVVTLGLALALWLSFLVVQLGFASDYEVAETDLAVAVEYAIDHPMVELDPRLLPAIRAVLPTFESNEMFAFLKEGKGAKAGATRQEEFDELEEIALYRLDSHPLRGMAMVPGRPFYADFLTYPFVHAGWIHALASVLLLLLVAPLLEVAWGRGPFAVALLLFAGVGGLAEWVVFAGSDEPLVGSGPLLAGVVAALLVRFHRARVAPFEWLGSRVPIDLRVPSWSLAAAFVVYAALDVWATRGALPGSLDAALGLPAQAAAAAVGALGAVVLARSGLEARLGEPPSVRERPRPARSQSFDFQRVMAMRARGDVDEAWEILRAEIERSARHRDAVMTFFEMAVERGEPAVAVPAMFQLMAEEVRRGVPEVAVSHWRSVTESVPGMCLDPPVLIRLVPVIQQEDGDEHAKLAIQQLLERRGDPLKAPQLVDVARLAADLDADLAAEAAQRALRAEDLRGEQRQEMDALVRRLEPKEEPLPVIPKKNLPENAFYAEQDRSAFGDSGADLAEMTDPAALASMGLTVPVPEVTEVRPVAIEEQALVVLVAGKGKAKIPYAHVHGVGLVGVGGLSDRPVAVTDLLITGPPPSGRPLRVLRLRSDHYDARALAPEASSMLAALQGFAEAVTRRAGARRFEPDGGRPVAMFASLQEYETECLAPAAAQLGAER